MTWHYRARVREQGDGLPWWDVVEFYEHTPPSWTELGTGPGGDTKEELIADLERMLHDVKTRPVLVEL